MGAALHPMSEAAVRRARAALPAGADHAAFLLSQFRAIADLDALARRVERRPPIDAVAALDMPIRLSDGTTLWRLSPGALEWLNRMAIPWFEGEPETSDLSIAWAMAHGRDPAAIRAMASADYARAEVRAWTVTLGCPQEALLAAVDALLPKKPDDPVSKKQGDEDVGLGPVLSVLIREYGKDRDYWLFGVSHEEFRQVLGDWSARVEAEAAAVRKAEGKASNPDSYQCRAQWAFNLAGRELVKAAESFAAEGGAHG